MTWYHQMGSVLLAGRFSLNQSAHLCSLCLAQGSEGCLHAGLAAAYIFCLDAPDDVTGIGPCGEDWARLGQRGGRGEEIYRDKLIVLTMSGVKSRVWEHFEKVTDNPKKAHPLYVDRATPSTSTSSSQPPLKLSQTTLVLKPPLSDKRKRDITDKIADFVALDMRPVNIVEGEGFKQMMKFIEPGYTVPKQRLGEVMEEFGIPPEKRVAVVHDNAANMVLCAQQLSQNPSWGNVQGIRCAGHTLQLCINAAVKLDPICRVIAAARRLVGHFKKTEDIVSVLRPMITLTELLSQDVNASLSATLPMLVNMKRRHLLSRDDDSTTVKAVKKKITEEIDKRWELTGSLEGSIYIQAAVLDPRFKSLSFLDAEKRDDAYATVSDLAESLSPAEEATAQREDSSGTEESQM
ncbi:hypothetical protein F7725_015266 [Dissostichus mawsoni]|uniref:Uncharacterized protein n=1 Tax=Dissostichus mawsoni TaxID=36200 RepID=A0A7J5YJ12_DISMA|nr:hypothetical protein F7725_015266 [Dissostichus mawsoni]